MLFNSYEFLFVFLPLALMATLGASALGRRTLAKFVLFGLSLGFYAWWNPRYLVLLLALLVGNFGIGRLLLKRRARANTGIGALLALGVGLNLLTLGVYKYAGFVVATANDVLGTTWAVPQLILPLGLSFMVFQKIAFLADVAAGVVAEVSFIDYCLFVSFFPQLIAGPIVHHGEIIPQLSQGQALTARAPSLASGLTYFVLGLAKKVIVADTLARTAGVIFAADVIGVGWGGAWVGAVAYTLQLYFDFSGYSDMAVGLGLMFGLRLPANFDSPLRATSIIDFWQRWHMSLTRFLNAYVFNPLVLRAVRARAAQGKKPSRKMNLSTFLEHLAWPTFITMFLAGIWHGAGFQFLAFGVFHGLLLIVNHAQRVFAPSLSPKGPVGVALWRVGTFVSVVLSLVLFRSESLDGALRLWGAMFGGGAAGYGAYPLGGWVGVKAALFIGGGLAVVQFAPSVDTCVKLLDGATTAGSAVARRLAAVPTTVWGVALGLLAFYELTQLAQPTEFLYFRF